MSFLAQAGQFPLELPAHDQPVSIHGPPAS
jgi:hypothetical protein